MNNATIESIINMIHFYDGEREKINSKQNFLFRELKSVLAQITNVNNPTFALDAFAWDCPTSPIQKCIYDDDNDPAWDNCLYCHEPSERK